MTLFSWAGFRCQHETILSVRIGKEMMACLDGKSFLFQHLGGFGKEKRQIVHDKGRLDECVANLHDGVEGAQNQADRRQQRRVRTRDEHKAPAWLERPMNETNKWALILGQDMPQRAKTGDGIELFLKVHLQHIRFDKL